MNTKGMQIFFLKKRKKQMKVMFHQPFAFMYLCMIPVLDGTPKQGNFRSASSTADYFSARGTKSMNSIP